jgi:hypothetical protein
MARHGVTFSASPEVWFGGFHDRVVWRIVEFRLMLNSIMGWHAAAWAFATRSELHLYTPRELLKGDTENGISNTRVPNED